MASNFKAGHPPLRDSFTSQHCLKFFLRFRTLWAEGAEGEKLLSAWLNRATSVTNIKVKYFLSLNEEYEFCTHHFLDINNDSVYVCFISKEDWDSFQTTAQPFKPNEKELLFENVNLIQKDQKSTDFIRARARVCAGRRRITISISLGHIFVVHSPALWHCRKATFLVSFFFGLKYFKYCIRRLCVCMSLCPLLA